MHRKSHWVSLCASCILIQCLLFRRGILTSACFISTWYLSFFFSNLASLPKMLLSALFASVVLFGMSTSCPQCSTHDTLTLHIKELLGLLPGLHIKRLAQDYLELSTFQEFKHHGFIYQFDQAVRLAKQYDSMGLLCAAISK